MSAPERLDRLALRSPEVVRLAEEVSLAVLVDPALLRRARLELGPEVDAGVEADLWFSPLVKSRSPGGFVLLPDLAAELRRRLAADPSRLHHARERVTQAHSHFPPALRVEEELLWLSARPDPGAEEEIEAHLRSAVAALVRDGRQGIAHWAARALPSLPPSVRALEPARILDAGVRLRLYRDPQPLAELDGAAAGAVAWMIPPGYPQSTIHARLVEHGIELADSESSPGHPVKLPATEPLTIQVEWLDAEGGADRPPSGWITLAPGRVARVAGPVSHGVRLRTIDGRAVELRPAGRDPAAVSRPVFISYPSGTGRRHAEALYEALGGAEAGLCFFDTEEQGVGDPLPERVLDALLGSRVVVVLALEGYFTSRRSLTEFHIATAPFLGMLDSPSSTQEERARAASGIVLSLPSGSSAEPLLERLPPAPRARSWPEPTNTQALAELVRLELAATQFTVGARYPNREAIGPLLLPGPLLPPPRRIGTTPFVPALGLPPSLGEAFVGREDDMWRVHDVLTTDHSGSATYLTGVTVALWAGGGFGKTRLALEYLWRFGTRRFPGGLFWIDAEQDAELQLYEVLHALNPSMPAIEVVRSLPGGVPAAVARELRTLPLESPVLFVIDDVPEPALGESPRPLATWCPAIGEVAVIVTSRVQASLGSDGLTVAITLDPLTPDAAVRLLTRDVDVRQLEPDEWREVVEWVGCLPLALSVLHALLKSHELGARGMLRVARSETTTRFLDGAMDAIRARVLPGTLRGIGEAFGLSYDRLTPEVQHAARLLAWMAPAEIPEVVVEAFGPETFTPSTRATLRRRSLVAPFGGENGEFFGVMHRVLADYLRSRSPEPDAEMRHAADALGSSITAARGRGDIGAHTVRACAPPAIALLKNAPPASDPRIAIEFGRMVGRELRAWGLTEGSRALFRLRLRYAEASLGLENPETLDAQSDLAVALFDQGDYLGAEEELARVLEARLRVQGAEAPATLETMVRLAAVRRVRGDVRGARELLERVVEAQQRSLGPEHPDTLRSMNRLALVLRDLGDLAGAHELQERAVEGTVRVLGDDHPDTLESVSNLAQLLLARGALADAAQLQVRVLETERRILGSEHPSTLASMESLANTLRAQGASADAVALQERVVEARRRILGEDHPDTVASIHALALQLDAAGRHDRAEPLHRATLESFERLLGPEHPRTLASIGALAASLVARGRLQEAEPLQRRALEGRRRQLGAEHPDTLESIDNLAYLLGAGGRLDAAEPLHREALAGREQVLGPDHPATLTSAHNLALTLAQLGAHEVAEAMLARVLEARTRILGGDHPGTLETMRNLALAREGRSPADARAGETPTSSP